jgi:microcystin-dependent protein
MADPYVGEIRIFAFNYAPSGWLPCAGQLLNISQYQALFALIGTYYGGNGVTNFALPNLQSRVPLGYTTSTPPSGLSTYALGATAGAENITLTTAQAPLHTHAVNAVSGAASGASEPSAAFPATNLCSLIGKGQTLTTYSSGPANNTMNPGMVAAAGGNQPHSNLQPYIAVNFCIAIQGIFPPRP